MINKFQKILQWLDPERGYIAAPALAEATGIPLQKIWSYLTQWHARHNRFQHVGPPYPPHNGGLYDLELEGYKFLENDYYVIHKAPDKADGTDRQLGLYWRGWRTQEKKPAGVLGQPKLEWDKNTASGWTTIWGPQTAVCSDACDTFGDQARGQKHHLADNVVYAPGSHGADWAVSILRATQMMSANLTIWELPEYILEDDQLQVAASDVSQRQTIRGYLATDLKSLGALIHLMGTGDKEHEGAIESVTRRTLFQWGHPKCIYLSGVAADVNMLNEWTFRLYQRNLRDLGVGAYSPCYPALIVKGGDETVQIKFTSTAAGASQNTWVYTFPVGGHANWTLIKAEDGGAPGYLDCVINDVDYVTVSYTMGAQSAETFVKTVALFEGPGY